MRFPGIHYNEDNAKVHQIDIAATLSSLFGVPTPLNSIGRLIPAPLEALNRRSGLAAQFRVASHLAKLAIEQGLMTESGWCDCVSLHDCNGHCSYLLLRNLDIIIINYVVIYISV